MQVSLVTIFHDANVLKCVFERGQKMRERNKKLGKKKKQIFCGAESAVIYLFTYFAELIRLPLGNGRYI